MTLIGRIIKDYSV